MKHAFQLRKPLFSIGLALGLAALSIQSQAGNFGLAFDASRDLAFSAIAGGVVVIDVNSAANPLLVSDSIQTQGLIQGLYYDVNTQRLYIAAEEGDLEIWDLQDPATPVQLSVTAFDYFGYEPPVVSVAVAGNTAYVSTSGGYLHIVDVSDPTNPIDTGFNASGGNPSREVISDENGRMYLAGPDAIEFTLNADGTLSSANGNQYAGAFQIFGEDGFMYASQNATLNILDGNQSDFPFLSNTNIDGGISDIFVEGNTAYIAGGSKGLTILDVSDKSAPTVIGLEGSSGGSDVVVNGDYAYLRGGLNLSIIDISTPSSPIVVGVFSGVDGGISNVAPVAVGGPSQGVSSRSIVRLNGSNSYDVDGDIASYSWTQVSGKAVKLKNTNTVKAAFRAPKARKSVLRLTFELTVTDNDGATAKNQVIISVYPGK